MAATHGHQASTANRVATALAWAGFVVGAGAIALEALLTIPSMMGDGASLIGATVRFLSFFTIWGNIALILVYGAVLGLFAGPLRRLATPSWSTGALLSILLVAIVYHLLLAQLEHLTGLYAFSSQLLHTLAPAIMIVWWLARPDHGRLTAIDPFYWTAFPLVYLAYALVQSGVTGWIPYPFLDYRQAGWLHVAITCSLIAAAFMTGAYLIYSMDKMLARKRQQITQ